MVGAALAEAPTGTRVPAADVQDCQKQRKGLKRAAAGTFPVAPVEPRGCSNAIGAVPTETPVGSRVPLADGGSASVPVAETFPVASAEPRGCSSDAGAAPTETPAGSRAPSAEDQVQSRHERRCEGRGVDTSDEEDALSLLELANRSLRRRLDAGLFGDGLGSRGEQVQVGPRAEALQGGEANGPRTPTRRAGSGPAGTPGSRRRSAEEAFGLGHGQPPLMRPVAKRRAAPLGEERPEAEAGARPEPRHGRKRRRTERRALRRAREAVAAAAGADGALESLEPVAEAESLYDFGGLDHLQQHCPPSSGAPPEEGPPLEEVDYSHSQYYWAPERDRDGDDGQMKMMMTQGGSAPHEEEEETPVEPGLLDLPAVAFQSDDLLALLARALT